MALGYNIGRQGPAPTAGAEQFLQEVFNMAVTVGASDVHFEPRGDVFRVRFRIDGVLIDQFSKPSKEYDSVLNTLKVLANLDIAVHQVPQDGHFELQVEQHNPVPVPANAVGDIKQNTGGMVDVRISVFPTINGQVIVLRLLNRSGALLPLEKLGMDAETVDRIRQILLLSYGMMLITGPAGSGKTTTLYSMLQELRSEEKNIVTLEDPVEFHLDWMRQSEIHPEREFTYERAMSSILRQDPDVLMVGEIRDPHTAEYAVRSALVGRIVGSTIHANNTVGTIARLLELGIPRSILAYALNGVIAQRLARMICTHCKTTYNPNPLFLTRFDFPPGTVFYHGEGCDQCHNTGYMGRMGIFSVLTFNDELRTMIIEQKPLSELQDRAVALGMKTLVQDAEIKIISGHTTVEEAIKVV